MWCDTPPAVVEVVNHRAEVLALVLNDIRYKYPSARYPADAVFVFDYDRVTVEGTVFCKDHVLRFKSLLLFNGNFWQLRTLTLESQ